MRNLIYFLKRKYKEYLNYVGKVSKDTVLGIMMASSLSFIMIMAFASIKTDEANSAYKSKGTIAEVHAAEVRYTPEAIVMIEKETTSTTMTTSTVTSTETTTTVEVTSTTSEETTTETTTMVTTYSEEVEEIGYSGVGQYGYAINPDEYAYLAEVIEHEGGNCPLYVKEHIGICLLNRVFVPGFSDTIYGCKEQSGQYFNGYYPFSEESAELARTMIDAYNSGGDYWAQYCTDRGMTCWTKFQRNDYCVPGTTYVNDDYDCTSGGFWFHMYYSE